LASFAEQLGQHFDRIEQVSIFGNVKRSTPMHRPKPAKACARCVGRWSVVEQYHADIAIEYDVRSD
jgi:hypothetical protein